MTESFAKGVVWDLSDLYLSPEDPKLEADLKEAETQAQAFEAKYKPLFSNPTSLFLAALLADYKKLAELLTKPGVYAHLYFAEKTDRPDAGAFMQKIQTRLTDIQSHLIFFDVAWNRLDEAVVQKILSEPALQEDLHFLKNLRLLAPHTLAEGEEKIMAIKSNTSGGAFSRLFDETLNAIAFYVDVNGKKVKKTESEVLSLLHSPDRAMRRLASDSMSEGLKPHSRLLTYIYNMILADHRSSMKIRNFRHPIDSRNLANEIDLTGVQALISSVKKAYPIAQRYYRLKKKLLGLDKLYDYDRYAPIAGDDTRIDFDRCKKIVLEGYHRFSPEAARLVEPFSPGVGSMRKSARASKAGVSRARRHLTSTLTS